MPLRNTLLLLLSLLISTALHAQTQPVPPELVRQHDGAGKCDGRAVTDPAVRQRFRTFINSDSADQRIVFVKERGQIRPAQADEREFVASPRASTPSRWPV